MKKAARVIMVLITVFLTINTAIITANTDDTNDIDVILEEKNGYLRYQKNLEVMNILVTDPEKLELLLRPSRGVECDDEDIISLAKSLTEHLTNDYSKVKAIHNWVCKNIYYDMDELSAKRTLEETADLKYQSAATTLNTKKGVCDGYANLTCALLRAAGIPSQKHGGIAYSGGGRGPHAWNVAYIKEQNRWILIDTTWDTFNRYSKGKFIKGSQRQTYFDMDLRTFSEDHFFNVYIPNSPDADFSFHGIENVSLSLGGSCQYNASCPRPESDTPEEKERGRRILAGVEMESYMSSNPKVATVDQYGRVTTHAYGTTVISAALLDGSGLTASYVLTVEPQKLNSFITFNGYGADEMLIGKSYEALIGTKEDMFGTTLNKKNITWSTSNSKVVSVNKDGVVTAVGIGTAKITATYTEDGVSSIAEITLTVKPPLTGIKISDKTLTLKTDDRFNLSVRGLPEAYYPENYGMSFGWTSSNPEVVTVMPNGYLTALKEGTATITVTLYRSIWLKDKDTQFTDSCVVTVTK